jgi:hypothetical protein
MPAAWSAKDERQYKHILQSCRTGDKRHSLRTCKRMAAATVNQQRRREGRIALGDASSTSEPWRDVRADQISSICMTPVQLAMAVGLFGVLVYAIAKGNIVLPVPITGG